MYIHKGITMVVMVLLHLTTVKPLISKDWLILINTILN